MRRSQGRMPCNGGPNKDKMNEFSCKIPKTGHVNQSKCTNQKKMYESIIMINIWGPNCRDFSTIPVFSLYVLFNYLQVR